MSERYRGDQLTKNIHGYMNYLQTWERERRTKLHDESMRDFSKDEEEQKVRRGSTGSESTKSNGS